MSRRKWVLLLLVASSARGEEVFPPELTRFTADPGNPVFVAEGPGHWDVKIRERGWILREGEEYHLWFTGYDGTRAGLKMLGHATSSDGIHWRRDPANPVYREHWVEDVMVVRDGPKWLMFAEGAGDQAQLLESTDGRSWTRRGKLDVRRVDGTPIPPGPYGTPTAWREENGWYLLYERMDRGVWLAHSPDLGVWTHVSDEPVLRPGPAEHEAEMIAVNQVIRRGARYFAYYHGRGKGPNWSTNIATSTDRVHWIKFAGNPLLPAQKNKSSGILVSGGQRNRLYTMHDKVDLHWGGQE